MARRTEAERVRDSAQAKLRRRAKRLAKIALPCDDYHEFDPAHRYGSKPTQKDLQALAEVTMHGSTKEAAACMGVSYQTVKNRLAGLRCRLGTATTIQALFALGWVVIPKSVGVSIHE